MLRLIVVAFRLVRGLRTCPTCRGVVVAACCVQCVKSEMAIVRSTNDKLVLANLSLRSLYRRAVNEGATAARKGRKGKR